MARQGVWVQLEQSDMHLASNMAITANEGYSHTALEQYQLVIMKCHTKVWEERIQGAQLAVDRMVTGVIERHPAMVCENQTDGCLPCHIATPRNPQTWWRCKVTSASQPDWCRILIQEPTAPASGMPPAPPCENQWAPVSSIGDVPPEDAYIATPHWNSQFFNHDADGKDSKREKDFIPDLLTDKGTCTAEYTICRMVMQLTIILQIRAAYWVTLQTVTRIDRKKSDFECIIIYN